MRKDCDSCKHDEFGEWYCDDCLCGNPPTKWEAADYYVPDTNADRIRRMTDEELADFFFESPEIEFEVCEYCKNFGGHTSNTPCKHDMGLCFIPDKNEAFRKWLQQPCEY